MDLRCASHLSPNAILRPSGFRIRCCPVNYIGGPAEIAYLAQSKLSIASAGTYARWRCLARGFTILDSRVLA